MSAPAAAQIRAAVVEDCDALGRLHVRGWRETYSGLMPEWVIERLTPAARSLQWRTGLERGAKGPIVFIAEAEDRSPAGFAAAGPARDPAYPWQAEIYAVYVLQRHQRQGLGRALLRQLGAELAARERRQAGTWVLSANAPARSFYEAIGARAVHQRVDESEGWSCDETAYCWDDFPSALG
ncbi:GNAT family N-acetyltransferase [Dongia sp.]|uniref:GNAT family N-acetyltransferase n=1 Tax=Dongia sp. TaxID=1977262 RepID=UPI00374FE0F8